MRYAFQWIRSLFFIIQMYFVMAIMAVFFTPFAIFSRDWVYRAVHTYCRWVRWSAGWMVGLKSEIRGEVPTEEVLIAAKHQSFFDIIMIVSVVPKPKFIMKSVLRFAPILGWYAMRLGCVPVDRGKRAEAIRQMMDGVKDGSAPAGQLIIYPQGTRVAWNAKTNYKVGISVLYRETGQKVVPAATNVGVFWPRHGIYRRPGLAVVEFLEPIEQGMEAKPFMKHLEDEIETRSIALMKDAGFDPDAVD
ncbi:1-acyl-sn-glycerol-3-phosphate acyltransferase [Shimia thalassica]|uniref:1-acyl-sn-glycerol-3-phosphate acyltransferase n=1 Tax=Shimia thalassica TaxID=1715693 RepID=A0A0P1ID12_9RHOB|nr:lysophospholipid acyltransferase family protein [Shimia thalassica]CUK05782.1 1-acyl-sn-glycerol-3-phosphate acyltransferase [Shimia thalassica]